MLYNQTHCTERSPLDSRIGASEVLTEHAACQCNIAQDLLLHEVALVRLIASVIQHYLASRLDVSNDSLILLLASKVLVSHLFQVWKLRVIEQMPQQCLNVVTEFA